jgi:hypothetical protein
MKLLLQLLPILLLCIISRPAAAGDVIYAVPNGDWRLILQRFKPDAIRGPDSKPVPSPVMALRDAMARVQPGMTIQLLPGVYTPDSPTGGILFPRDGSPDLPITLRGMGSATVIDGRMEMSNIVSTIFGADEQGSLEVPDVFHGVHCLSFDRKQWIVLENLTFLRCADAAVYAVDTQYLTLRQSTIIGGLYGFFAKGTRSHHLLLEDNIWIQDPSEAMWSRYHWCEYKYGRLKAEAGALFASLDIPGDVIIRGNQVYDAMNGIHMDASSQVHLDPSMPGYLNTNVQIYDNDFAFIRGNVLELQYDATNLWFHGNRIRNAYQLFSFDNFYGGRWYVYDNVSWFDDKPSRDCVASGECKSWQERSPALCEDLHDGGTVFNLQAGGRYAPGPLYIFNNSWYLRSSVIKGGRLGSISHWNNAIAFCRPADYPNGLCEGVKPFFDGFTWEADSYAFSHDFSNHPDFPHKMREQGYRVFGMGVPPSSSLFIDAAHGDLTLIHDSPARGAACRVVEDDSGLLSCQDSPPESHGPDVGASSILEASGQVVFIEQDDSGPYPKPPQIVHVELLVASPNPTKSPNMLRIYFSVPIVLKASQIRAELDYGIDKKPLSNPCSAETRVLTCEFTAELPAASLLAVNLPNAIAGPTGLLATAWGSESDLISFRP